MRFRFIEEHGRGFPINRLCQVLDVSERGLRAYRGRPTSQGKLRRKTLITNGLNFRFQNKPNRIVFHLLPQTLPGSRIYRQVR